MSEAAPAAVIRTYDDLRRAIDAQRRAKGWTMLEMDSVVGLADGHAAKLICGSRHFGSLTLPLVLDALGIELVVRKRAA
jgi:hypothetical protein